MEAKRLILSRGLPKTGQSLVKETGDDGTYQAGWWKGLTLGGNRTRLIPKTLAGDAVVLDLATGLMWAADGNAAGCGDGIVSTWTEAITYITGLDFAGFIDWRMPNIKELLSIIDYRYDAPAIPDPPFINCASSGYFSSTTGKLSDLICWSCSFEKGITSLGLKTGEAYLRAVRGGV